MLKSTSQIHYYKSLQSFHSSKDPFLPTGLSQTQTSYKTKKNKKKMPVPTLYINSNIANMLIPANLYLL